MGILKGPNLGDIAQYSRNFRLRRQQSQGAYGASRHKRCAGGSSGSSGSADEWRARRTLKPLPLFLAHVVSAACRGDWPQNPPILARRCGCPPGACPPSSGGCEPERGGGGVAAPSIGTRDLRPATLRTCPPPDVCGQVGLAIAPSLVRLCGCAPGQRSLLSSGCELRRPR